MGRVELFAFGLVATFLDSVLANRLGVLQLPDVRQQLVGIRPADTGRRRLERERRTVD